MKCEYDIKPHQKNNNKHKIDCENKLCLKKTVIDSNYLNNNKNIYKLNEVIETLIRSQWQ